MGQFYGQPELRHFDDGVNALLLSPLSYKDDELGLIVANAGLITDGGSIPKLFQNIISPWGVGLRGFVLHDAMYKFQWFTKDQSDRALWRMLKDIGECEIEASIIYDAVNKGGWDAWNFNKLQIEKNGRPKIMPPGGLPHV